MGLQVSTGGNLSMRLQEDLFLVKPSGIALFDLEEEDLLVTDASGAPLEDRGKPTKEINTHLGIYKIRQDVGGIVPLSLHLCNHVCRLQERNPFENSPCQAHSWQNPRCPPCYGGE